MSLSSNQSTGPHNSNKEYKIIKELSQSNQNNGYMAQIFHTGVATGALNLSNTNQAQVINAFAQNLCMINQTIVNLYPKIINSQCFSKDFGVLNHPLQPMNSTPFQSH